MANGFGRLPSNTADEKNFFSQNHLDNRFMSLPVVPLSFHPELLPLKLRTLVGEVDKVEALPQARCNLVLRLDGDNGIFLLKIAEGDFRISQLRHETHILKSLRSAAPHLPLAVPLAYAEQAGLAFLLETYLPHDPPLNTLNRVQWQAVARCLAEIHALLPLQPLEGDWLTNWLKTAQANLNANRLDPQEFESGMPPTEALDWLTRDRPSSYPPVLLHGDFRPKNLLWQGDTLVGVVDWAFCTAGDPYYDLAILREYLSPDEWLDFFNTYGNQPIDFHRLAYFEIMAKFLNV